jgi:hypothetical protein
MPTFETPGPLLLSLRVPAGAIAIETTDGHETEVELEPLERNAVQVIEESIVDLRPSGEGHELVVEIEERRFLVFSTAPRVQVRIRCPHGAGLDAKTVSADVRCEGRLGETNVKSVSGDLHLQDVAGDARIKSVSGDVRLGRVDGAVEVQTVSGDVSALAAAGNAVITTVSGDLRLDDAPRGATTKSVSGDHLVRAVRASTTCQSVSGDVIVTVRPGTNVYIDANSRSGDVTSELDPSDGAEAGEGQVAELRVKTMSGDIRIARA